MLYLQLMYNFVTCQKFCLTQDDPLRKSAGGVWVHFGPRHTQLSAGLNMGRLEIDPPEEVPIFGMVFFVVVVCFYMIIISYFYFLQFYISLCNN